MRILGAIKSAFSNFLDEKGQVLVIFAVFLPVLLGVASLAVEVGYIYMAKSEMQVAADAAALASVRELVADNFAGARTQAITVARANNVAGREIVLNGTRDVEFGRWESKGFTVTDSGANAVRVTIREFEGSPDGGLPLFIAPLFGIDSFKVEVTAIATLASIDLVLVLDRSGSMDDDSVFRWFFRRTRQGRRCCFRRLVVGGIQPMDTMRAAAISFVGDLDAEVDQVGVVSYSSRASSPMEQTLTNNFSLATTAIRRVERPGGFTNIGDGMAKAISELKSGRERGSTVKIIILLSDGEPTCRSNGSCGSFSSIVNAGKTYALEKADEAKSSNFIVHTISLGSRADRSLMQGIASRADGSEFFAGTGAALSQVFQSIRERIPVRLAG
jgi:hypothetical protein